MNKFVIFLTVTIGLTLALPVIIIWRIGISIVNFTIDTNEKYKELCDKHIFE